MGEANTVAASGTAQRKPNIRAEAARVLAKLARGGGSLGRHLKPRRELAEFALLQEICFGVCRHRESLDFLLAQLLARPLRERDSDLRHLLLGALYQLRELAIAEHAVVDQTVEAAGALGKLWSKPLINAVLRGFLRRRGELEQRLAEQPAVLRLNHPPWLASAIEADWPDHWRAILKANNVRPPMTLRANLRKTARAELIDTLQSAGLDCGAGELAPGAIYLATPKPVAEIPGFTAGLLSVQDEASQLAAGLLGTGLGAAEFSRQGTQPRVLDACAAPGGKTCHLLEHLPQIGHCLALDKDGGRVAMIGENLARLELEAELAVADAAKPEAWWDGIGFDRILLDAPCSASGVIRRHPDIKILLRERDVESHAEQQFAMLGALWQCLQPGGRLLYTTCSVLRRENEQVILRFLKAARDAKPVPINADWGIECAHGRQLLPGAARGPDGFYFCLLEKCAGGKTPSGEHEQRQRRGKQPAAVCRTVKRAR